MENNNANTCPKCSVGNLTKLKNTWEKTKSDEDRENYLQTLKKCNDQLLREGEI